MRLGSFRYRPGRVARRFFRNRVAVGALGLLGAILVIALISNWWSPKDPNALDFARLSEGPSWDHWLGTDSTGRDVLSRLFVATRVALLATLQAVAIGFGIGTPLGVLAGYAAGKGRLARFLAATVSRLNDALMSMPPLILAIAIVGVLTQETGRPGLGKTMVAVGVLLVPRFFRVSQAATRDVSEEMYVEAARASGSSVARIMFRHLLPAISSTLLVQVSFAASVAIVAESSLSFIGLGVQPPQASWGSMLQGAFQKLTTEGTWGLIPPGFMIALTVLALSLVGDGLRDALGRQTATER